jgi:hypothetical protein
MHRTLIITIITIIAAASTACYSEARVRASYSVAAPAPDLVYVSPGVYVIADYDYPVFYADHVYWRYDGGVWYRSRSYNGGWRVSRSVPVAVRRIDRPAAYVHYRGRATVTARDHRRATPAAPSRRPATAIRDHREAPRRQAPAVRDHRGRR